MLELPSKAESKETMSSGLLVPKDTTVNPITKEEIRILSAKDELPRTNPSAPRYKINEPKSRENNENKTEPIEISAIRVLYPFSLLNDNHFQILLRLQVRND